MSGEKPGLWRETGFLRQFRLSTKNIGRNPVSEIPCVARNRVSATISVEYEKYRQKPGFWD
ncbi:MAG: hypothetical protein EAZ79_16570 [Oscillatoriales cyanobacterium]|nr:MAG: hypothetical protein EAZ79_16570 [Oscillatoriales cyanobacterium]